MLRNKRAFFGTYWRGGLGAIGRCLNVASRLTREGFDCYFFSEGVTDQFVQAAGGFRITPPSVEPPNPNLTHPFVSAERVVGGGGTFRNLSEFYGLRGYADPSYVKRAFEARFACIRRIDPDIIFTYWSWESALAARILDKPLVAIIQSNLHPSGGGFSGENFDSLQDVEVISAFNELLSAYGIANVSSIEELMLGDLTLISGAPSVDTLREDQSTMYCGPLLWFPRSGTDVSLAIPEMRKVAWVYASADDSWVGGALIVRDVVPALLRMGFFVLVSSGGHPTPPIEHPDVRCTGYFPGGLAAMRADVVVGRGGHDLFWTAITAGRPFFGVPPNTEWLGYCRVARRLGVGDYAAGEELEREAITEKIRSLVYSERTGAAIERLRAEAADVAVRANIIAWLRGRWPDLFVNRSV